MTTIVELCVHMDCAGCESKIRKALEKLKGADSVEIDMARQKVTVTGHLEQKKVLKAVRRTGRRAVLWPFQYGGEAADQQLTFSHQHHQHHPALAGGAPSSSSYNYYKHGYEDSRTHGYYYHVPPEHAGGSGGVISDGTGAMFSDENPNACSVM